MRVPLARGASAVQANASGGAYLRDEGGRAVGGGAGAWEVVSELNEGGSGGERQVLVWRIDSLGATDRPAVLSGQYFAWVPSPSLLFALSLSTPRADARTARSPPDSRKPPAFTVTFSTPSTAFSGLRISALKLVGEPYSVYKGVKSGARGVVEVRTG